MTRAVFPSSYSSMAPPIRPRCSRKVVAGLEERRARNSENCSCVRSDVPWRIFSAWVRSISRIERAIIATSSARAIGRNTTPFTSPIATSSVPTVQEPTRAETNAPTSRGSSLRGPVGHSPRLNTGSPISRSSCVSRCSPQMTIPARGASFVSRAIRSPTHASSRRPELSTTRTSPGEAFSKASRKISTLP